MVPGVFTYRVVDWDVFWRWEILRRRQEPLDFLRWKADSSRELRALPAGRDRDGVAPLLLDSSCGLGYHAMVQRSLGFRVEACDRSEVALAGARALMAANGLEVPTFAAAWDDLGRLRPGRYDLVFNDEIHQVRPRDELLTALRGIHGALRPGGAFVFFFADAAKPDNGPAHADWDWEHVHRDRLAWSAREGGLEVSLHVMPERAGETLVLEHHVYLVRDATSEGGGGERVEAMVMARNYGWDWAHVVPVLEEAGFDRVESHAFVSVKGNDYTMNLAFRAG